MIEDFDAGERIDVSGFAAITSFADLNGGRMTQSGSDVLIDTSTGTITLENLTLADFNAGDFAF